MCNWTNGSLYTHTPTNTYTVRRTKNIIHLNLTTIIIKISIKRKYSMSISWRLQKEGFMFIYLNTDNKNIEILICTRCYTHKVGSFCIKLNVVVTAGFRFYDILPLYVSLRLTNTWRQNRRLVDTFVFTMKEWDWLLMGTRILDVLKDEIVVIRCAVLWYTKATELYTLRGWI